MRIAILISILILLALIALSLQVNAISVASDYLENNTLELISGTSKIYSIRLQNPTDEETGIKLDYDQTFIKVIDYKDTYILAPKVAGYKILFNVTAPKKLGLYNVGYSVGEVDTGGGTGLSLRLKIGRGFKLRVVEEPNTFHINYGYVAYAVIILVFLIYMITKKHFKKRPRHKSKKIL